jgi:membrane-associated PAP2 superfamily phosphatase
LKPNTVPFMMPATATRIASGSGVVAALFAAFFASAMLIIAIGTVTDIDLNLARLMYDAPSHSFPWRHTWFAEAFSHNFMRTLLLVAAIAVVAPALWDLLSPRAWLHAWWRKRLRVVALSAVLVPLAISLLKQMSSSHCPWDVMEFGGTEHYVRLLQAALHGVPPGRCMPAGHASSGLWLVSVMVFWLPHRPRTAALVGLAMLGFGFALGWVQQMRGAHFLTHTLWSMWIASAIVSMLCWRMLRQTQAEPAGVTDLVQPISG